MAVAQNKRSKRLKMRTFIAILVGLLVSTGSAQASSASKSGIVHLQTQYQHAAELRDWALALVHARQLKELSPGKGMNWDRLAHTYFELTDYQQSRDASEQALKLGYQVPEQALRIAKSHLKEGNQQQAVHWLLQARKNKMRNADIRITSETDFAELLQQPVYRTQLFPKLAASAQREQQWQTDLKFLDVRAREAHDNLFSHLPEAEWNQSLNLLIQHTSELSDMQIRAGITELLARVGDGHTLPYAYFSGSKKDQMLPLGFFHFEDGIFVVSASKDYQHLVGKKLLAINQIPVKQVLQALEPYISRDNSMNLKWMAASSLSFVWMLDYAGVVTQPSEIMLTLTSKAQAQVNVTVATEDFSFPLFSLCCNRLLAQAFSPSEVAKSYHYHFDEQRQLLRFDYHQVSSHGPFPLKDFLVQLVDVARQKQPQAFVLNLRNNNGGNGSLNPMTMKFLLQIETLVPAHRFFVLIGRNTFSAAMNLTSYLERWTNAIFIGEPTGSSPNFTGENDLVLLPNSGLTVSISSRHWLGAYSDDQRIWLAPDVHVPLTSQSYFNQHDEAMLYVYRELETSSP